MDKINSFLKGRGSDSAASLKPPKIKTNKGFRIMFGLFIIALMSISFYYYHQYKKIKDNPDASIQEENKSLLSKVYKIMDLPQDETPTIATVSDKDKLKDQDFFKNSENGDKILIFSNSKIAIMYRPSANKIMKVAPLVSDQGVATNNDTAPQGQVPSDQNSNNSNPIPSENATANSQEPLDAVISKDIQSDDLKIVINNGTTTAGLTKELQEKLSGTTGINVISTGKATKKDYTKTLIIDLTHKNTELIDNIAQTVDGEIVSLPDGETAPKDTDILIIAGK
jgi:hypothetical protein